MSKRKIFWTSWAFTGLTAAISGLMGHHASLLELITLALVWQMYANTKFTP